ncbi:MAG: hypothetical protein KatS3mg105_0357 [Gemmatales bacterium]|nr:MAG: hypothetical protein KatS3mg105_0357 [Gemmatales bacterium]
MDHFRVLEIADFLREPRDKALRFLKSIASATPANPDVSFRDKIEEYFGNRQIISIYESCATHSTEVRKSLVRDTILLLRKHCPNPAQIAVYGSGIGEEAILLKRACPDWVIHCYDLKESYSIKFARFRAQRVGAQLEFIEVDSPAPFVSTYHAVISFEDLQHCFDAEAVLASLRGALKNHGKLLCTERFFSPGYTFPETPQLDDESRFETWMLEQGFHLVERHDCGPNLQRDKYLYVFRKSDGVPSQP